jgi:hypothetical protein
MADQLLDPTRPLSQEQVVVKPDGKAGKGLPKLQAIVRGLGPSKAILDGVTYSPGARVGDYQLTEIRADGVILLRDNHRLFIPFYSSKVNIE